MLLSLPCALILRTIASKFVILVIVLSWRISFLISSVIASLIFSVVISLIFSIIASLIYSIVASLISLRSLLITRLLRLKVSLLMVVGALMPVILLLWLVPILAALLLILPASVFSWWRRWKPLIVVLLRRYVILVLLFHWFFSIILPWIGWTIVVLLLVRLLIRWIVGSRIILPLICILLVLHPLVILTISLVWSSRRVHLGLALVLVLLVWRSSSSRSADLLKCDVH